MKQERSQALCKVLAETYSLCLKTQFYHWNVVGSHFFALHQLFEKQYLELFNAIDQIAEHLRTLGDIAPGSFKVYEKLSKIPEAPHCQHYPPKQALEDLTTSHKVLLKSLEDLREVCSRSGDKVTEDFTFSRIGTHRTMVWMLEASL